MLYPDKTSLEIRKDLDDLSVLRDAIDAIPHPFSVFDTQDKLVASSKAYRDLHKAAFVASDQITGQSHRDIVEASFRSKFEGSGVDRKIESEIKRHRAGSGYTKDVNTFGYWARRVNRVTEKGSVVGYAINIDELVNKSKALAKAKRQMEHQAGHDPLTGLPNRRGLQRFIGQYLDHDGRALQDIAILHVDLDKFKSVNDSFGHDAGDAVLLHASALLRDELRASDYVARVGGDEFIVACLDTLVEDQMAALASRLVARLSVPISFKDDICQIGGSIGIAFCPKGWSIGRVLTNADLALYEAKRNGRGCHAFYSSELRESHTQNEKLAHDIRNGISTGEFEPYFQPQIDAITGQISGFEALARWNHRKRGLVNPAEFIPAAEDAGLMNDIDHVIMSKSFAAMRAWLDAGLDVPQISINISGDRLSNATIVDQIKWSAESYDLDASKIGLEILESVLVEEDQLSLIQNVKALRDADFRVELDDFGTGHASISGLRTLSVDRIKIDRSLITNIHRDQELKTITGAIIGLAKALDIEVLAEGVECDAEQSTLVAMGCRFIQGFGIARPMSRGHVEDWMHSYQARVLRPMHLAQ